MTMHFDMADLRLMVRIADANSLTKGAEASHVSLPAASTRLKHIEESVGAKLFYRTGQGVTLTPPGQALVHHARLVLAQMEHLQSDLQEYAKGIKGHVRMSANTTSLGEFLPPVLGSYLLSHPDVYVDLRERSSHDSVRGVCEGRIDIGIVAGTVRTEGLEVIPYRHNRLELVVPQSHPLSDALSVDFVDTLAFDHVGLTEGTAIHSFLREECDRLHRRMTMRIQVGNFETVCRLIEVGVGIGIVPASAALRHSQTMAIKSIPLRDPWAHRAQTICVRKLGDLPRFARDLVDFLVADARAAAYSELAHDARFASSVTSPIGDVRGLR